MWSVVVTLIVAATAGWGATFGVPERLRLVILVPWGLIRAASSEEVRADLVAALSAARRSTALVLTFAAAIVVAVELWPQGGVAAYDRLRALSGGEAARLALVLAAQAATLGLAALIVGGTLTRVREPLGREVARRALHEAGLLVWLTAVWSAPLSTPAEQAAAGCASVLASRFEGDGGTRPRRVSRAMLAVLAAVLNAAWIGGAALRVPSFLVDRLLFSLPGDFWLWVTGSAILALAAASRWTLTRDLAWHSRFMNRLAASYLSSRDASDEFWRSRFEQRHRGHTRPWSRWRARATAAVRTVIESLIGRLPSRTPRDAGSRVDQFLSSRLAAASREVDRAATGWALARLRATPGQPADACDEERELARALKIEARRLWLSIDYHFCPSRLCTVPPDISVDMARELAVALDRHLLRRATLRRSARDDVAGGLPREAAHAALRARFLRCAASLAGHDVIWRGVPPLRPDLFADDAGSDTRRIELDQALRAWIAGLGATGEAEARHVFCALLETHAAAGDWASVIESARRWLIVGRRLSDEMRTVLGAAWFHQALDIDGQAATTLARFAVDQAAGEFFAAAGREYLAVMSFRLAELGAPGGHRHPAARTTTARHEARAAFGGEA
jgi:hypothetical protein